MRIQAGCYVRLKGIDQPHQGLLVLCTGLQCWSQLLQQCHAPEKEPDDKQPQREEVHVLLTTVTHGVRITKALFLVNALSCLRTPWKPMIGICGPIVIRRRLEISANQARPTAALVFSIPVAPFHAPIVPESQLLSMALP